MLLGLHLRTLCVFLFQQADKAFWTLALTQWLKQPPSEYHRAEVLYDVLLPWLAGTTLPQAVASAAQDPAALWVSPQVRAASPIPRPSRLIRLICSCL